MSQTLKERLLSRDPTLWKEGNVSQNRLGWLDILKDQSKVIEEITDFEKEVKFEKVILLGMGGSSLGPLVLASINNDKKREVIVNDTTHPKTISEIDFADSLIIVSSKSGTTLEPSVLFSYAFEKVKDPKRFIAITDPGTALDNLGKRLGFLKVFTNQQDIGGRYSVLSFFGLVPACLSGYKISDLIASAQSTSIDESIDFGLEMGKAAAAGKDKMTIITPDQYYVLGLWLEQLFAESTGKDSKGLIPVPTTFKENGPDRFFIEPKISSKEDLGRIFFEFEIATAMAGHVLGIDPFDEPNVKESKENTNQVLQHLPINEEDFSQKNELSAFIENNFCPGDYISVQAYVAYGNDQTLEEIRIKLSERFSAAPTTKGYGPRFLHSTGQLHKGGPNTIVAIQIQDNVDEINLSIPGKDYDFGTLIKAQALGDYQSLIRHNRRVIRIKVDDISEISEII